MDSFYGGKSAAPFVIQEIFPSISAMVTAFKQGGNYTDVYYQEYCLIDTPNKNDPDNGKIFLRGLDYQNNMGGAIYKGQIVGPSSGTPYFQMLNLETVEGLSKKQLEDLQYRRFPIGFNPDGTAITAENGNIATSSFNTENQSMIPGKNPDGTFNDEIKWTWVNLRDDGNDADSWFYVGFKIPYMVIDFDVKTVNPYDDEGQILQQSTVERTDDGQHPFYEQWLYGIPHGIKGDTLRNLRWIIPQQNQLIYSGNNVVIDPNTGAATFTKSGYSPDDDPNKQNDDIANKRAILVFDYYTYDQELNPIPHTVYLGDYNMIASINVADDGTLTVGYTHDNDTVFDKRIQWIDSVTLSTADGPQGGIFTVQYNNGAEPYVSNLQWVKDITIGEDGTLTFTYAGKDEEVKSKFLKWVKNVTLDPDTGEFEVTYNNDTAAFKATLDWIKDIQLDADGTIHFIHTKDNFDDKKDKYLKWITSVDLNTGNGKFTVNFNNGEALVRDLNWVDDIRINETNGDIIIHSTVTGDKTLEAKLKLITAVTVANNGDLIFSTNTGQNITATGKIKLITNVSLGTGIKDDKHIQVKYNTETVPTKIGNPINYLVDMKVKESNYHLLALYSDPEYREVIKANNLGVTGEDGSDGTIYDNTIVWRDFGAIKDQSGVLVGKNVFPDDIIGYTSIIEYLNDKYPIGLDESTGMKGKVVTFGVQGERKEFYAFDYNTYKWYYLGEIAESVLKDVLMLKQEEINAEAIRNLTVNGLAFIISTTTGVSTDPLPNYWEPTYVRG